MLQIEEWFRRSQRKPEKRAVTASRPAAVTHTAAQKEEELHTKKMAAQTSHSEETELKQPESEPEFLDEPEFFDEPEDMFEQERTEESESEEPVTEDDTVVSLQDSVSETDELEHISQKIGMDVADMIDMDKEDVLIQQIDEFREKAKQLQQLMQNRESKAKELQGVVEERTAKANSLDRMVHVRRGEADKIMKQVSQRIDAMSMGVRTEMSGLSDSVSKEVGGLTQNLTNEINQSTEKTRLAVEAATQNMIDQNTRSLEGLKEQLEQLDHSEQIGELSTEMNSQMTTLKADIVEKIHAEDVKCYRNIQVSLDDQSKLLSESDEKIRGLMEEQMNGLKDQMSHHATMIKASLVISVLNLLGIAGIIALLVVR